MDAQIFSQAARDEVDLDQLVDRLVGAIDETMQPAHMSLWLSEHGPALSDKRPQEAKL